MNNWINIPLKQGQCSKQAHADLPQGSFEREIGREGFFGPATHIYHAHRPTSWLEFDGPIRPRAFDLSKHEQQTPCPSSACPILCNADCKIGYWNLDTAMPDLYRNADGDQLMFVHQGCGELFCDYGHMTYRDGDYLLIPRGTLWRIEPKQASAFLLIEATGSAFKLPDRGILGQHAQFDPAILEYPQLNQAFIDQQGEQSWKVRIKARQAISTMRFGFNPLDAIGWKGQLSVFKLNWRDIRAVMSDRYHLAPSAHTSFVAPGFVVCTFTPRPIESDPGALKVPFFHSNDDYDEFLFYHRGQFFSRDNIHPGMSTLHPAGFAHGPHPKAFATGQTNQRKATDEVAVMVDTRQALNVEETAESFEWTGYVNSWQEA
ncbi:homogentisate 1,2-dioxygenase [Alginatibacterium sediminis]|uniref:Homogentisate 1,2-dioxygenase n=1 Tax=Alginatibacterium sediminis TaxID=2164068 RepID=A0A420EHP9_9ALTE|nr:homogentisate 1,2-dioxygenase [Alginatibacterium sediminis]RKF20242.1 homogentisate 1,2-dioxygenase [Alginatibacterium sediminis]